MSTYKRYFSLLTLILLTWTIWRAPTNASKWRMEFNSVFEGLTLLTIIAGHKNYLQTSPSSCSYFIFPESGKTVHSHGSPTQKPRGRGS